MMSKSLIESVKKALGKLHKGDLMSEITASSILQEALRLEAQRAERKRVAKLIEDDVKYIFEGHELLSSGEIRERLSKILTKEYK